MSSTFYLVIFSFLCMSARVANSDRLTEQALRDMLLLKLAPRRDCQESLERRITHMYLKTSGGHSEPNKCIPDFISEQTDNILREKVRFIKQKAKLTGRAAAKVTGRVFPALADNLKTVALQLDLVSMGNRFQEL